MFTLGTENGNLRVLTAQAKNKHSGRCTENKLEQLGLHLLFSEPSYLKWGTLLARTGGLYLGKALDICLQLSQS